MDLDQNYEDLLMLSSAREAEQFELWTYHLPKRKTNTPFHSGPHSIKMFSTVIDLVLPDRLLEIGFCLGHSATIFRRLGVQHVTSVDNSDREETLAAAKAVSRHEGDNHFRFMTRAHMDKLHRDVELGKFDMVFIDGAHDYDSVFQDLYVPKDIGCRYVLMDDWWPHWGPGVQQATYDQGFMPIAIIGSMALCVPTKGLSNHSEP